MKHASLNHKRKKKEETSFHVGRNITTLDAIDFTFIVVADAALVVDAIANANAKPLPLFYHLIFKTYFRFIFSFEIRYFVRHSFSVLSISFSIYSFTFYAILVCVRIYHYKRNESEQKNGI